MPIEIKIGTVLHGFCNGFFGRDSYNDKVIEGIGKDWVVARDECGNAVFADFPDGWKSKMQHLLSLWSRDMQWGDEEWLP